VAGDALTIRIQRVGNVRVELPRYMTPGAAGMDVCAAIEGPIRIGSLERARVPSGFAIAIPRGYEGQVRPRSGAAWKHGLSIPNAPGTIDSDYRGEICVVLVNLGGEPFTVRRGDRIAQVVFSGALRARLAVVEDLDGTVRGPGGFGHTGR